jgi:hypothetical protein
VWSKSNNYTTTVVARAKRIAASVSQNRIGPAGRARFNGAAGRCSFSLKTVTAPAPRQLHILAPAIAMDGERIARAVARYREGEKQPLATTPETSIYGSTFGPANASSQGFGAAGAGAVLPGAGASRWRCRRFERSGPDPHSLAALFEQYDDRDGWRKNRPRGCPLPRRRTPTASDDPRDSAIRVYVWARECVLARVRRAVGSGSRPRATAGLLSLLAGRPAGMIWEK